MAVKINFFIMAYRNLLRHKVKTILTGIAIVIGVALYIYMDAFLLGADIDSQRNLVNFETGAAKIYSKDYFDDKDELPLYDAFGDYSPIMEKLSEAGYNSCPHAVFAGSLASEENELPFVLIGIDPALEKKVFQTDKYVESGTFVKNGAFEVVLGVQGAKDLKADVGDLLRLTTVIDIKDEKGVIHHVNQLINLKVAGIINSPDPKSNGKTAYLPLDILQDNMGLMLEGRITELCIRAKNTDPESLPGDKESPERITKALGSILPGNLTVVSWEDDAIDFLTISRTKRGSASVIIILLFIITVILISNTMLMAIFERTREIGMLRAMGMNDGEIIGLFMLEAGMIGLAGSIAGIIIGILINFYMVNYGIDISGLLKDSNIQDIGYRIVGVFKSAWNFGTMVFTGIGATIVAAISAYFPARRAVKKSIVDSLRYE